MKVSRSFLNGFVAVTIIALFSENARGADTKKSAYSAGQAAPAFQAKTVEGKPVRFSGRLQRQSRIARFLGHVVRPCRAELPNVVSAYQQFHSKGFDVLSVSLDQRGKGQNSSNSYRRIT